jgi:hypothetical protein
MGHGDAGGDILAEKQLFYGDLVRLKQVDQLLQILSDLQKPRGQGQSRLRVDGAVLHHLLPAAVRVDHAEADDGHAGVDP